MMDILVVVSSTKSIGSRYMRFNALPLFVRPSTYAPSAKSLSGKWQ